MTFERRKTESTRPELIEHAARSFETLADVEVRDLPDGVVQLDITGQGDLPLTALLVRRSSASQMVVHLHGTLDRKRYQIPRFERLRSLSALDTNLLLLADTTLTLEPSLPTAWFVGSPEVPLTDRYAELIARVRDQWAIDHTVIAGSSSGGFAALALAPRVPDALSLAFSPQTRIRRRPTATPFRQFVYNRFGGWDGIEARTELRPRVDLVELYSQLPGGNAWYVQNSGDAEHMEEHAKPFLAAHGDRVSFVSEYHCPGHNPPTAHRVAEWVEHALANPSGDPRQFIKVPPEEVPIIVR